MGQHRFSHFTNAEYIFDALAIIKTDMGGVEASGQKTLRA
jgi:hypothetical protein